jgi:hypothetical protein
VHTLKVLPTVWGGAIVTIASGVAASRASVRALNSCPSSVLGVSPNPPGAAVPVYDLVITAEQSGRRCRLLGGGLVQGRAMHVGMGACNFYLSGVWWLLLGQWLMTRVQTFNQCMLHNVGCVPLITSQRGACHTA